MKRVITGLLLATLLFSHCVRAENMIMLRVSHPFETSMILLKEKLNEYGYKIAHIQKCDGGLSEFGYKTDFYKSVFFGKFEETRKLTSEHPELIPYLPLKVAVMKETDTVLLVALNPSILGQFFPVSDLEIQFARWESDIRAIFEEIGETEKL